VVWGPMVKPGKGEAPLDKGTENRATYSREGTGKGTRPKGSRWSTPKNTTSFASGRSFLPFGNFEGGERKGPSDSYKKASGAIFPDKAKGQQRGERKRGKRKRQNAALSWGGGRKTTVE